MILQYSEEYEKKLKIFLAKISPFFFEPKEWKYPVFLSIENETEKEIQGVISYEVFSRFAFIRYFIFYKSLPEEEIKSLYQAMEKDSLKYSIDCIFSACMSEESKELFLRLGFYQETNENLFINDIPIQDTDLSNAFFMKKEIRRPILTE